MANYCDCDLYVYGSDEDIQKFLEHAKGEDQGQVVPLDFGRFIPKPKRVAKATRREQDWERWGTTSNAMDTLVADHPYCPWNNDDGEDRRAVKFTFCTSWSPPIPVVLSASRRFRGLRFSMEYYEARMGFHGRFTCEAGKPVENLVGAYYGSRGG